MNDAGEMDRVFLSDTHGVHLNPGQNRTLRTGNVGLANVSSTGLVWSNTVRVSYKT